MPKKAGWKPALHMDGPAVLRGPMKQRLDVALAARGLCDSREQAKRLILAGEVLINGQPAAKAGTGVGPDDVLGVKQKPRYVSRGGLKLEAALQAFGIDVTGLTCMDVGASTGGF